MEILCTLIGALLVVLVVLIIAGAILLGACKIVGIDNATLWGCVGVALMSGIVSAVVSGLLEASIGQGSGILGAVAGFLIEAFIISAMFHATYGRALLAALMHYVLWVAIVVGLVMVIMAMGVGASLLQGG